VPQALRPRPRRDPLDPVWKDYCPNASTLTEGQKDVAEVSTALRIVLQLEGVTCQ
jgi:hypothetical protein